MSSPEIKPNSYNHVGTFIDQGDRCEVYVDAEGEVTIECYIGKGINTTSVSFTYDELDSNQQHKADKVLLKK